jgi:histidyl-tRNA synthetase
MHADCEMIIIADRIMKNFGAKPEDYEIRINSLSDNPEDLENVIEALRGSKIENIRVDETLARGQAYYTGVVFEFFDTNPENNRSILGGGRYDNLTSLFGDADLPAVGFGAGDVTIRDFLETHNLLPEYRSTTRLIVALTDLKLTREAVELVKYLRMEKVNAAIDWTGRKVGDQIKNADKNKVPFVLVFGEDEVKSNTYKIKNLKTGEEIPVMGSGIAEIVH